MCLIGSFSTGRAEESPQVQGASRKVHEVVNGDKAGGEGR